MTVDLNMMIDMRDAQLAAEVGRKAELGWFDIEFTMYGCCYIEKGERQYRLSAEAEKIYDFIETAAQKGIITSNINKLTEKYPVPIGMRDSVALDVKKELAMNMQEAYPYEFFEYLQELRMRVGQENGYEYLLERKDEVEGCFQTKSLQRFEEEVDYLYECNKITKEHEKVFKDWLKEERKNIEEEPIHKEIYEKTFYGIGYIENGAIKYVVNARKESVYRKRDELLCKGIYTTPLYQQNYYYSFNVKLPQVKERYENELKAYFNLNKVQKLKSIVTNNITISEEDYEKEIVAIEEKYGVKAKETMVQYGYRWGILALKA